MKKLLTSLVAVSILATMTFCVTGCGSTSNKAESSDVSQTSSVSEVSDIEDETDAEEATEEATEEDAESESNSGKVKLEEYISSDAVQEYIDSINESQSDTVMEIKADGDKLIYEYTFSETIEEDGLDVAKETLESSIEQSKSVFTGLVDSMSDVIDVENPAVVVRYLNTDGSVIYEIEFTADAE